MEKLKKNEIPKSPNQIFHREKPMVEKKWKAEKMGNSKNDKYENMGKLENGKTEKSLNSQISQPNIS